jgi:hypothetical protein
MGCVDGVVLHVMIGVEGNGDDFSFPQPVIDLIIVSFMVD